MGAVRLNVTIPEELVSQLDRLVGSRNKSRFITEALRERIERIQEQKLAKILEEGYKSRKQEGLSITRDFEPADLEGWDEY